MESLPALCFIGAPFLRLADGDPFQALIIRLNSVTTQRRASECEHCGAYDRMDSVVWTGVATDGVPDFIALELPDRPPRSLAYNLHPAVDHQLAINGDLIGNYKLISVIMYKTDEHFIANVFDKRTNRWICYDGIAPNGLGEPIEAEVVARGRTKYLHGHKGEYFPVAVAYVRMES